MVPPAAPAPAPRADDPYEMVIKARLFRDVYKPEEGWAVEPYNEAVVAARNVQTVFVAPVGHFNAGKTFVTNKLSGKNLPCGDRKHTEGLSIAVTRTKPGAEAAANQPIQQIAWMDTAGLNSPVVQSSEAMNSSTRPAPAEQAEHDPVAAAEHGRKAMDDLYTRLREVKRLEDFHRRVAFEFADVFLFVINQISHNDQLEILLLLQQIHRANANKSVFVVHNLRGWDKAQMEREREDGYTYISRIKTLFFMQDTKVNVSAFIDDAKNLVFGGATAVGNTQQVTSEVTKLYGTFKHPAGSRVEMQHVFLVDDEKDPQYNACVLTHLRNEVTLVLSKPGSVKWHVENVITKVQHLFAQTNVQQPPLLRIVPKPAGNKGPGSWSVHMVKENADKSLTVSGIDTAARSLQLPSYLTLGSDDLQYNVLKLKGSTATTAATAVGGAGNVGPGAVEKIMYAVQFVIPGLHPEDVDRIKEQMKWNGGALRLEQSPEGRKALVIDFGTTEHIAQKQLLAKIQNQVDREAIMFTEGTSEVVEDGTRPFFDRTTNSRPVTVQIRTGLEKLSTMTRPLVAYNDGILSIVVTSSERPPRAASTATAAAPVAE